MQYYVEARGSVYCEANNENEACDQGLSKMTFEEVNAYEVAEDGTIIGLDSDKEKSTAPRLYAFWNYDVAPFLLGGEVGELLEDGRVRLIDRFSGMVFRPVIILPYEKGVFYQKLLDESEKEYMETVSAALQKCKRLKDTLLQYHSDSSKSVKRAHISMIRSGDTFLVNGKEYTAAEDSHYNQDEDVWVVYDTEGNSFFEEDIEFKLEE